MHGGVRWSTRWSPQMPQDAHSKIANGMTVCEVAHSIGVKETTLRSAFSNRGLSLRVRPSPERIKVPVGSALREKIDKAGRRRGTTGPKLAAEVLRLVFDEGLLDAVLDDR